MTALAQVLKLIDASHADSLQRLFELLTIPSISTDPAFAKDCQAAADWCRATLEDIGFSAEVIATNGHPVVVAHDRDKPDPKKPHVLFYGHYDVQPVDPLAEWESPPFEPRRQGNNLYARGASDMKGQIMAALNALQALRQASGSTDDLPIRFKFLFEGEEEEDGRRKQDIEQPAPPGDDLVKTVHRPGRRENVAGRLEPAGHHLGRPPAAAQGRHAEGEHDADAGASIGLLTTTTGGTGAFTDRHISYFEGRNIVIVAHADGAGRAEAEKRAAVLHPKAANVKIVEIPGCKDLAEGIDDGVGAETFQILVEAATAWRPATGADILEDIEHILRRFVALEEAEFGENQKDSGGGCFMKTKLLANFNRPHSLVGRSKSQEDFQGFFDRIGFLGRKSHIMQLLYYNVRLFLYIFKVSL